MDSSPARMRFRAATRANVSARIVLDATALRVPAREPPAFGKSTFVPARAVLRGYEPVT
jgi:hypothetical protein